MNNLFQPRGDFDFFGFNFIPYLYSDKQHIIVSLGINRSHAHLSEYDCVTLFDSNDLIKKRELLQPGEYVSTRRLRYKKWLDRERNHYTYDSFAIVGPFRSESQLEITAREAVQLGGNFPFRMSGDTVGCPTLEIVGSTFEVITISTFIAINHIHLPTELSKDNLRDLFRRVRIHHEGVYNDLVLTVRYHDNAEPEIHLNEDYAQMFNLDSKLKYHCELLV
jgi:putative phosphotransacetylase